MDKNYAKAFDVIWKAKADLRKLNDSSTKKTFEDKKAYKEVEVLIEALEEAERNIMYYSKLVKEGVLKEDRSQQFYICFNDGSNSSNLHCGDVIEVYLQDDSEEDIEAGWYVGRAEHDNRGYYFYGPGKPMLYTGMRARTRE